MNCFSAFAGAMRRAALLLLAFLVAGCGVAESESADRANTREYSISYAIRPEPGASTVFVSMQVRQPRALLRELSFDTAAHIADIDGDGEIQYRDERVVWTPPADGGTLEWRATVRHERGGGFDALLTADWGIFRMEDIVPRVRTRVLRGSLSRTSFEFELPAGWTAVTEYSALRSPTVVDRPERAFDQPTGWIALGRLGVRRETIAGTRVGVAAPEGQDVRRLEMLALLNWTLPELNEVLPDALPRLTIVSTGAPMWRGGLSAPASLFLHADRPLISENATSPLLHEVMHAALRIRPRAGYDWIVEGLAEYYGIELLRRGRAISNKRAARAFEQQATWGQQAKTLCAPSSTGATTARAVSLFAALDTELAAKSDGEARLDDLLPGIAGTHVDLDALVSGATTLIGSTPDVLHIDELPGCRTIAADNP